LYGCSQRLERRRRNLVCDADHGRHPGPGEQKALGRQGNPNYRYYALAATQYGPSGDSTCNSSNGNTVASSCIFYDVSLGDIDAVCTGSTNCYTPSGANGVLSTSNSSYAPAYGATTGWDFATGIGSVNVYNLVMSWNTAGCRRCRSSPRTT